jgi:polysaccharide biosynthesis/export protein PslD
MSEERMKSESVASAVAAVAFFSLLSACASTVAVPPAQPRGDATFQTAGNFLDARYLLEPGDTIKIHYLYHPELDRTEVVRPDGKIRISSDQEVQAAGLSTAQVAAKCKSLVAKQLRDPEVGVSILQYAERSVYVAGEVGKPGPIPYRRDLTPLQALVQAGGVLPTGLADSVVLVRPVAGGRSTVSRTLDIRRDVLEGVRDPVHLAPHDILYVPKSSVAEADVWVDQHVTQMLPFLHTGPRVTP